MQKVLSHYDHPFVFEKFPIAVSRKKFSSKWYKICYCTTRIRETYFIQRLTKNGLPIML